MPRKRAKCSWLGWEGPFIWAVVTSREVSQTRPSVPQTRGGVGVGITQLSACTAHWWSSLHELLAGLTWDGGEKAGREGKKCFVLRMIPVHQVFAFASHQIFVFSDLYLYFRLEQGEESDHFWLNQSWLLGIWGFPGNESSCQCKRCKRRRFDPWVGKIPWERNGNPLQYSCWEILWTEEPCGLQSMGLQSVGYDWATEHAQLSTLVI